MSDHKLPFVICSVKNQLIGISCNYVKELVILPPVTLLPDMPQNVRGIFNNRGAIVHVMDLRARLSMNSSLKEIEDLISLMYLREEDHKKWIDELCKSTNENRPFLLATDHHKCAFGKWYDSFTTGNYVLALQLEKFNLPHTKIHAIAEKVEKLKTEGNFTKALELIEKTRNTELKQMLIIFEETRQLLLKTHREIAIIIEVEGKNSAIAVDRVNSVEYIPEESMEHPPAEYLYKTDKAIINVVKRNLSEQIMYIVDPSRL